MSLNHWITLVLITLSAGWMTFDGMRAFIKGDYVTPKAGRRVGQLGPWSLLVKRLGIEPRAGLMKAFFVSLGLLGLILALLLFLNISWARWAVVGWCAAGLWYLPVGTLLNLVALVLAVIG